MLSETHKLCEAVDYRFPCSHCFACNLREKMYSLSSHHSVDELDTPLMNRAYDNIYLRFNCTQNTWAAWVNSTSAADSYVGYKYVDFIDLSNLLEQPLPAAIIQSQNIKICTGHVTRNFRGWELVNFLN